MDKHIVDKTIKDLDEKKVKPKKMKKDTTPNVLGSKSVEYIKIKTPNNKGMTSADEDDIMKSLLDGFGEDGLVDNTLEDEFEDEIDLEELDMVIHNYIFLFLRLY